MELVARQIGVGALALAAVGLALLHLLPGQHLHATTGALIPYRPWNLLSEYARTEYALLMTACFFLLAIGVLAATVALWRRLRRESALLAVSGIGLALMGIFPADLIDLQTSDVTCGQPGRIEPCTPPGQIHSHLAAVSYYPLLLAVISVCFRSLREPGWRSAARLALICGALALCGMAAATLYQQAIGWQGRWWTGLLQRSVVFPVLLWVAVLLVTTKHAS